MTDLSFKYWHVRLNCDAPGHRKTDPEAPDVMDDEVTTWTKARYRAAYRALGWIFHHDGRLTCPQCKQDTPS